MKFTQHKKIIGGIFLSGLSVLLLCLAVTSLRAQSPDPVAAAKDPVKPLMRVKLDAAKNLLEGLALEDYEKVRVAASQMRLCSLEAGWNVLQTERYQFESQEFRRNCESVIEAAKQKDTGRIAVGYIALTVRCVECHDHIRNQLASNPG